ncbi:type IV pilin protein [Peredibacter starrii]|uniref:Prepilin-type N-terminal cleavage/methylation domain-containing protein n=1 Tax=Peredibacter starrii TaxID=28202 RepID=A0AAX4HQM4_9BACT|nr:prepilin-type N-terminal cleavage/methylation domain-containing protein [Peredibacter starrii]WPU65531.1 prepilin-type N-terminal cleavage/methylation domain-containing protein [Peredibacter starrii]
MKTFFRSLKRQDGFTLVELMVVVAIIGLLSAVAIPNFRKYQAKAKMSEAKLQLSSVYTAETAFFSDFNIYHNCLAYMGYNPHREMLNRYYAVGFKITAAINANAHAAAVNSGLLATSCPANNGTVQAPAAANDPVGATVTWYPAGKGVGNLIATSVNHLPDTPLGTQADQGTMTFTAGAGGIIDGDYTANTNNSQLTINEQKVMSVVRNGF